MGFFVRKKRFYALEKAYFNQLDITKYYQNLYAQAISTQNVLNSMLKEATSHEKTDKHTIHTGPIERVCAGNDNSAT